MKTKPQFKVGDEIIGKTELVKGRNKIYAVTEHSYLIHTASKGNKYEANILWVEKFFRKLTKLEKTLK